MLPIVSVAALILALFGIAAITCLAASIAFALPSPTGSFPVGTMSLTLPRQAIIDHDSGTYTIQIWYPSVAWRDRAPYGVRPEGAKRFIYDALLRTHSGRSTPVAHTNPFPIVLYVAGWGCRSSDNTVLAEALASHGFVVAALGDVAFDDPPPARLSLALDFSSQHAYESTREIAGEKLRYEARRASAVLDRLLAMNAESGEPFEGRLDPKRIGIYGFSLGGAVALETTRRDPRFKATMNMDGLLFDADSHESLSNHAPYFLVSDASTNGPAEAELTSADPIRRYSAIAEVIDTREQRAALNRGGYSLNIDRANHLSFTDAALYSPMERLREGALEPRRISAIICRYAVAFFETSLAERPSPLFRPQVQRDAGVAFQSWPHGQEQDGND